jgi:ferredoxin--NADP+ reductase
MKLSDFDLSKQFTATLVSTARITPNDAEAEVRHLIFEPHARRKVQFFEGQSVAVVVPGPHEFGNKEHIRFYSVASPRGGENGQPGLFSLCVRRCFYLDEVSGERYPGKASHYLCDLPPGSHIQFAGPFNSAFTMPEDESANLLMIGVGTGIAPFRAFIRHIYEEKKNWKGEVRLFYGARTGTELLYLNDPGSDLHLYYDDTTFQAFEAVSPRPHFDVPPDIDRLLEDNTHAAWRLVLRPNTWVYLAGQPAVRDQFEKAMAVAAGSESDWKDVRADLVAEGRYSELLYE